MSEINWGKGAQTPAPQGPQVPNLEPTKETLPALLAQPAPQGPLQEISPEALDELFQRDPREITDLEFEKIVLHYRSQRGRFIQAETEAAQQGKKQTRMPKQDGPKAKIEKKPLDINLGDLNLGALLQGPKS